MSSSGKPSRAKPPQAAVSTPPTGTYQSRVILMAAGPGFSSGSASARHPDAKTP